MEVVPILLLLDNLILQTVAVHLLSIAIGLQVPNLVDMQKIFVQHLANPYMPTVKVLMGLHSTFLVFIVNIHNVLKMQMVA